MPTDIELLTPVAAEIPVFRPSITEQEVEAVATVLRSGWLGPGPRVAELEAAFAASVGAACAVSVSSGTDALAATLHALGVGEGDEVVLPSFTYPSAVQVILGLGAVPVFADIEPEHLTIDPVDVARRLTPRTRGIIAVHHGGQLADVDALLDVAQRALIWLVDDAAHAAGASSGGRAVGSLCRATCFSFGAIKNMTTGDGGMVTTADPELAARIARYRSLGIDRDTFTRYASREAGRRWDYGLVDAGRRCHMNDIAAALGLVQLRRLPELNARRQEIARRYDEAFRSSSAARPVVAREGTGPSWHMYTLRVPRRDRFVERMREMGIAVGVHYVPLHQQPRCHGFATRLPVTEASAAEVASLPIYPDLGRDEQEHVIRSARTILGTS